MRIEAESLALSNYVVEGNTTGSGGRGIRIPASAPVNTLAKAIGTFTGPTGTYSVRAGYWDENDGVAKLSLTLGNTQAAVWTLDGKTPTGNADASTHLARTLGTFHLTAGESVILAGIASQTRVRPVGLRRLRRRRHADSHAGGRGQPSACQR